MTQGIIFFRKTSNKSTKEIKINQLSDFPKKAPLGWNSEISLE